MMHCQKFLLTALTAIFFINGFSQKSLYDFGALGSSNMDESVKVQNAINASVNKTLFIPDDTFYVRDLSGVDNITIRTIGKGMLKYYTGTAAKNGKMLLFNGKKGWTLDGLVMDGSYPAPFGTILQIIGCKSFTVKNSTLKNCYGEGVAVSYSANGLITNNKIINTDVAFFTVGNCSQLEFSYNGVFDGRSDGFAIWGRIKSQIDSNITIHHNSVYNKPKGSAFLIRYAKNLNIYENYVEGCSVGFGHDEAGDYKPGGMTIRNNHFHKCRVGINAAINNSAITGNLIDSTTEYAVLIGSFLGHNDFTFNNVIKKNIINTAVSGIRLDYATNIIIDSNQVMNCTNGSAFDTYGVSRSVIITNNYLSFANYGIYATLLNSRIENNTISEMLYTALSIGADSVVNNDTIRNNQIINASTNNYEDGIRLQQSNNSIIDGNSITDTREPVRTQTGVRLMRISNNNIITNNKTQALQNIVNGGVNTILSGNTYTPYVKPNKALIVKSKFAPFSEKNSATLSVQEKQN